MSSLTLLTLPEEIRHQIYANVYPTSPTSTPIPLAPLSHALPCTSKQLYCETLQCYLATTSIYYTSSRFSLLLDHALPEPEADLTARILAIPEQDFDKISNLTVTVRPATSTPPSFANSWTYTLVHPLGGWRVERPLAGPNRFERGTPLPTDRRRVESYRRFKRNPMRNLPGLSATNYTPGKPIWEHRWSYYTGAPELTTACEKNAWWGQGGLRTQLLDLVETGMLDVSIRDRAIARAAKAPGSYQRALSAATQELKAGW